MNIWLVVIIITVISVILSVVSLINLENKSHVAKTKEDLFKDRVIFQDSSAEKEELASSSSKNL